MTATAAPMVKIQGTVQFNMLKLCCTVRFGIRRKLEGLSCYEIKGTVQLNELKEKALKNFETYEKKSCVSNFRINAAKMLDIVYPCLI